jgi:flagellar M-ring protein FliF
LPATAPLVASGTAASESAATGLIQKDSTTNYEVDKTIRYTQQPMGGVKRLSVAVVINYKTEIDKNGKSSSKPLSDVEKTQITDLIKEAMGFNKERGDTLNVVNSPFANPPQESIADTPLWKQPDTIRTAKEVGKYILVGVVLLYLFFGYLKPMLYKMMGKPITKEEKMHLAEMERMEKEENEEDTDDGSVVNLSDGVNAAGVKQLSTYEINLDMAKQLATSDPKIVANVIKSWVSNE